MIRIGVGWLVNSYWVIKCQSQSFFKQLYGFIWLTIIFFFPCNDTYFDFLSIAINFYFLSNTDNLHNHGFITNINNNK